MEILEGVLSVVYVFVGLLVVDGIVSALQRRTPFWMTRQILRAYIRYGKQTAYLWRLIDRDRQKSREVSLPVSRAIKAVGQDKSTEEPVVDIIERAVMEGSSLVLSGEQGAGKTIALQEVIRLTAQRAFRSRIAAAVIFVVVAAVLVLIAPWMALLWAASFVFWETVLFRTPLPLYLHADGAGGGTGLLAWYEHQVVERLGGKPLFHEDNWVTLFVDGVDQLQPHQVYSFFQDLLSYQVLYPQANVIVNIRPEIDLSDVDFDAPQYVIQPLDDEGLRVFIAGYLQKQAVDVHTNIPERINQHLQQLEASGLSGPNSIARNSFWLEIMLSTGSYSHNKASLLTHYTEQNLREVFTIDARSEQTLALFRSALAQVSLAMQPYGFSGLTNQAEIQHQHEVVNKILNSSSFTVDTFFSTAKKAGIIEYEAGRLIQFSHPLLQIYFAAYAIYLKDDWEDVRRKTEDLSWWPAIFLLGGLLEATGNKDRLKELTDFLTSDEASIRQYLAIYGIHRGLGEVSQDFSNKVAQGLMQRTPAGFGSSEQQAIEQLVMLVGEDAVELFENMYHSQDPHQQLIATILLCATGIPQCDDLLLNRPVQETLPVFQSLGSPAIAYLITKLESDDDVICYRASELLIAMGKPVLDFMGNELYNPQARVRRYVTRIIARISGEGAFQLLYLALEDDDYDVWYEAADGLRALGSSALAALKQCAEDPSIEPHLQKRIELILSAKLPKPKEAAKIDVAQDYDPDTSKIQGPSPAMGDPSAFQVLLKPGFRFTRSGRKEGSAFRPRPYQISASGTGAVSRKSALEAPPVQNEAARFEKFDFPPDFEQLLNRLRHTNVYVRSAAIEEVRKFGTMLVPYLLKALETDNKAQVEGVLDALAEVANINSLKTLRAFRDKAIDPAIRKKADRVIQRSRLRTL
jgi:HEAT repeat protein